ncbi:MAG: hypothetical protein K2K55_04370, partial [Duncaniella sp.]|nr:hypothetical protein [Duncaniella sp.]
MTTDTSIYTDGFSWRRVMKFGLLYRRELRIAAIVFGIAMVVSYLLTAWTFKMNFMKPLLLISMVSGWFIYSIPLLFAFSPVNTASLLPIKPIERWTFLMLFPVMATVYTNFWWYGTAFFAHLVFDWPTFGYYSREIMTMTVPNELPENFPKVVFVIGIAQLLALYYMALAGVFSARRHPLLKGIGGILILFGVTLLMSIVWGIWFGFKMVNANPEIVAGEHVDKLLNQWLSPLYVLMVISCL